MSKREREKESGATKKGLGDSEGARGRRQALSKTKPNSSRARIHLPKIHSLRLHLLHFRFPLHLPFVSVCPTDNIPVAAGA